MRYFLCYNIQQIFKIITKGEINLPNNTNGQQAHEAFKPERTEEN